MSTARSRLRHVARVARIQARASTQEELQYRANFWGQLLNTLTTVLASLVSIWVVYGYTSNFNGWSRDELLFVVGSFFVITGIVVGVFHMSLADFTQSIRTGTFDYVLVRPVDAQLLTLVRKVSIWRVFDTISGTALIAWALVAMHRHGQHIDAGSLAVVPLMFAIGIAALAAVWMLVSYLVFWTINMQGVLYALDELIDSVRWPLGVYPWWLQFVLTVIFPAGLAVTLPGGALTGRVSWWEVIASIALALVLLGAARALWLRGLAHYDGASA